MKILIATFTFLPEANGVSHVCYAHASGLVKRGHEVTVITTANIERNLKQMRKEGINVIQFYVKRSSNIRKGYSGEIEKYQNFIANFEADVMFFHCWQTWTTDLAIPVFYLNKAKKVLVSHGVSANTILSPRNIISWLSWRPYIWKMPLMLKTFDHLVFLSTRNDKNRFYDYYLTKKLKLSNYSIIPNAPFYIIRHKNKSRFKEKYGINSKYMILHVANYNFIKNQKMAIKAFIKSRVQNTTLVFIGSEKNIYTAELEAYVSKHRMEDKIFFMENLSKEEIVDAYQSADIFLCSSLSEVQPLAILDAMGCGVPFISTNVGCVSDIPGGVIVRNLSEMASKIRMLIENDVLRNKLGKEGLQACEKYYSWEIIINKYEDLIKKLLTN